MHEISLQSEVIQNSSYIFCAYIHILKFFVLFVCGSCSALAPYMKELYGKLHAYNGQEIYSYLGSDGKFP